MLGVPVGFEIRIDFAVPGVPSATHARTGIEVGERAHRCAARPIAAGDGREIRFGNCTMSSEKPWRRK